jgi:hypothetical protein
MTITIIGDTNRRTSYNPNLAEKLAEQIEEDERQKELEAKLKKKDKQEKTKEEKDEKPEIIVSSNDDYITLENIICKDSEGNIIEQYNKIQVLKDIERDKNNPDNSTNQLGFTPYEAIEHFEKQNNGFFAPSYALSCNILAALFKEGVKKDDEDKYVSLNNDASKVLDQYLNYGLGYGWHSQNTVINWESKEIIHYPKDSDFPSHYGTDNINKNTQQTKLSFNVNKKFNNALLEKALKDKELKKYIQNLTGLENPAILAEIGKYFKKDSRVWVPNNPKKADYTASAWLGSNRSYFNIVTGESLGTIIVVRGVREIK